jgi:Zn-dependent protease with chaperone function
LGRAVQAPFQEDERKSASKKREGLGDAFVAALWSAICLAISAVAAVVLVGAFGTRVIGVVGVWSSRVCQAAVSRRRELLADDLSARYTRNPTALAKALRRIQLEKVAPCDATTRAPETAHLFFTSVFNAYLFRTHPDLSDRIARLDSAILDWKPN